jgi:multiple sugar transport system permease protein
MAADGSITTAAAAPRIVARSPGVSGLQRFARRRSTIAFLMTLPLLAIIGGLVVYPFFYALYLSTLNRTMTRNIGLGNFEILLDTDTFWLVIWQSCIFAVSAVLLKALIGFVLANQLHAIPTKGQKKWRGMLLIPWVIPPALSTLGWWWMFDPSYSSINWLIGVFGVPAVPWLGEPWWARVSVIMVNVWYGAPFFMIMYLAALKSVPEQLYEAAAIDGATGWQGLRHITLPMMRNIISITVLFSLIVTFANYDIVRVLTNGGPRDLTHVFATYAFQVGILSGNVPRGAAVSLFMFPMLAIFAFFILRDVTTRNKEQA